MGTLPAIVLAIALPSSCLAAVQDRREPGPRAVWSGLFPRNALAASQSQQAPARDARPPQAAGSASIRGRVISAETGEPVRRARVVLSSEGPAPSRAVPTDLEGRYEFAGLPAGRYRLTVSRAPYVTRSYGQRSPLERGTPIDLADGERLDTVDVALPRAGMITGRVTDDLGDPVVNVTVATLRRKSGEEGAELVPAGRVAATDDLGRFRLPGLNEGTYFLGVLSPSALRPAGEGGIALATTYYPGTAVAAGAQPIAVRAGEERGDVTFTLVPSRTVTISGRAFDEAGRPLAGASIYITHTSVTHSTLSGAPVPAIMTSGWSVPMQADGRFSIAGVGPGEYTLRVGPGNASAGIRDSASVTVTVSGADIEGLLLTAGAAGRATGEPALGAPLGTRPAQKPGGTLRGRVLAGDTAAPLRRASVTLAAPEIGSPRATTTGLDGRFEFKDLPAARYTLTARKAPYVALEFGQRTPFERGAPLDLTEGQTLDKIELTLPPGSAISGRIVDDLGDPAAFIGVRLMRFQHVEGRRQLVLVASQTQTDDAGQYRFFGLAPGAYYVGTLSQTWDSLAGQDQGLSFAAAYYPGVANVRDAQPVTLGVAEERASVDVALITARMARLSGWATDSRGQPLAGRRITLRQDVRTAFGPGPGSTTETVVGADGRFTIPSVAPGEYVLSATVMKATSRGSETANLPVTVTGEHIENLVLMTVPAARITGQIEFERGISPGDWSRGLRIAAPDLQAVDDSGRGRGVGRIGEDWSFEIEDVAPGTRLLRLSGLPNGWALKSVLVDGRDVTDTPLQMSGARDVTGVRVILTSRATEVSGTVTDDRGRPARACAVVVYAADASRWVDRSRFIGAVRTDQHSRYVVSGLPAGKYLAVAVDYLEDGQSSAPEFLEAARPRATAFSLSEGEEKVLDLRITKIQG